MQWQGKSTLSTRYSGLAILIFPETAEIEFINPRKITAELKILIKQQSLQCDVIEDNLKKLKTEIKKQKEENYKNVIERLTTEMNDKKHVLWIYQLKLEFQPGWRYFQWPNLNSNFYGIQ